MEVQRRHVPHFKGLIYAKVDLEAQGRDSTFTFCHAHLKKAILHHRRCKKRFVFSTTVALNIGQDIQPGFGWGLFPRFDEMFSGHMFS